MKSRQIFPNDVPKGSVIDVQHSYRIDTVGCFIAPTRRLGASVAQAAVEPGCAALPMRFLPGHAKQIDFSFRFYFIYNIYTNLCHLSDK